MKYFTDKELAALLTLAFTTGVSEAYAHLPNAVSVADNPALSSLIDQHVNHYTGSHSKPLPTPTPLPPVLVLNAAEQCSGHNRVVWAEGLIEQLPPAHDGRNSWLMNYGIRETSKSFREANKHPDYAWCEHTQSYAFIAGGTDVTGN